MKIKRSERLIDMTHYLLERPHDLVPLTYFAKRYGSAKSSISEDLAIVKHTFQERGIGIVETVPGVTGGARYIPYILKEEADEFINGMIDTLNSKNRFLPGGYIYMSDILGQPTLLNKIGRIIATQYLNKSIDAVLTVATRGVPLAEATASYLNVPLVIARHDSQITEGSTISVNYVSGFSKKVKKMTLSKRSLPEGANVLIIDDYLRGGGTIKGLESLINEFNCNLVGSSVFVEGTHTGQRKVEDYTSLLEMHIGEDEIKVTAGNYENRIFGIEE
ncbi:pur operon repressor [Lactobacillus sp. S2-2]|uniref:pur operon repressor n=1 Tax=Lactobacillus sp. S2-2 TaxID=2692917 RepID=UPI001F009A4F|nr:pur operon repressor [Lactobacillus sp. S2-2]MCF6515855.1 pur operon repressor [Lactobacillus sp. S2-2]